MATVRQKFAAWKANKAYDVNEEAINSLGYEFLGGKKVTEAITLHAQRRSVSGLV